MESQDRRERPDPRIPECSLTSAVTCLSCGAGGLEPVQALGETPLASSLVGDCAAGPEPRFPLDLVVCPDL